MKKKTILIKSALVCALLIIPSTLMAQVELPQGKEIYIPKDLQKMDLEDPESKWSFDRMASTDNFAIFWEKGFGNDLSNPPELEGQPMQIDLENLKNKLEQFYVYFRDTLQFVKSGSKSERYRMMVMLNYSLERTAYGGDYDKIIGALWIAPNRIQDEKLNCIAHELGHCFQTQVSSDGDGEAWGGSGFYEMTSQWMLWLVNPDWMTDENYHWEDFIGLTHKAFLHMDNIYHSPYVIEYWSEKHGLPFIAELYRNGLRGEDPVMTYKKMTGLSQEEFCDEMFDAYRHFVNWDLERVRKEARPYANQWKAPVFEDIEDGWKRISPENCPENYGFNVIALPTPKPGETIDVSFSGEPGLNGYVSYRPECAGWRYGIVAVTKDGESIYGELSSAQDGMVSYTTTDEEPAYLWLVVMGAPTEHWMNPFGLPEGVEPPEIDPDVEVPPEILERITKKKEPDAQWPYKIKIEKRMP